MSPKLYWPYYPHRSRDSLSPVCGIFFKQITPPLKEEEKIMQPLQNCIGPAIRIGRESWCLPYAGYFFSFLQ